VRLYATWLQQALADGTSLRVGLQDLNNEFYATEASSALIHPAFGIGSEFAQTGRNGPSIFPVLSMGVRLRTQATSGWYGQAALLDAIPGDPAHPGRTVVRLSGEDGTLLVAEGGWQAPGAAGERTRRWGLGAWTYSRRVPRIEGGGRARNAGVYAIAEGPLPGAPPTVSGFVRAGLAEPRVNAVDAAFDAGVSIDRPWGERGPSFIAGIAASRLGADHRHAAATAGATLPRDEIAIEVGLPWRLGGGLTVQPLVQHVRHAAGRPGAPAAATLLGVRWIVAIGDDAP
jgi:porin